MLTGSVKGRSECNFISEVSKDKTCIVRHFFVKETVHVDKL